MNLVSIALFAIFTILSWNKDLYKQTPSMIYAGKFIEGRMA